MLSFIFALLVSAAPVSAPTAPKCETYAPNLEGISVTVCSGEVVSRCDASGNCLFAASTY
jgi:hypothetical protein